MIFGWVQGVKLEACFKNIFQVWLHDVTHVVHDGGVGQNNVSSKLTIGVTLVDFFRFLDFLQFSFQNLGEFHSCVLEHHAVVVLEIGEMVTLGFLQNLIGTDLSQNHDISEIFEEIFIQISTEIAQSS